MKTDIKVIPTKESPGTHQGSIYPLVDIDKQIEQIEKNLESIMPRNMVNLFSQGWLHPHNWEFPLWSGNGGLSTKPPKVDIIETDEDIVVNAEIPGVKKENIKVEATELSLIIKGSTKKEKDSVHGQYHKHETMEGEFFRSLPLPCGVVSDSATANYKDGILTVTIKKQKATKRHEVKIT